MSFGVMGGNIQPQGHAQVRERTGAGGDSGTDHNQNWLRFPYDSTFLRSPYLHPHPYH
eukprot:COSAG01_NODE_1701_length_9447_cov_3.223363_16_plen_58_part_00